MQYVALQLVWHAELNRYLVPGETATFDHLVAEEIRTMVETGQIKPAENVIIGEPVKEKNRKAKEV